MVGDVKIAESRITRMVCINTVTYSLGSHMIRISKEQGISDQKFYKDSFNLRLLGGSIIRKETRTGYDVYYNCSEEKAIIILQKAIDLLERSKFGV